MVARRWPRPSAAALDRLLDLALAWEAPGGLRAAQRRRRGADRRCAGGVSGLRPVSADAPHRPTTWPGGWASCQCARAGDARPRRENGGEATTGLGPAHGAARGRRHAGRGAARAPAAGAARRRRRGAAGRGRARPARRAHHAPSRSTTSRRSPPRRATRRWSTAPRPAPRSRRYAASSCCSTTGAPSRPPRCAAAGSACATSRRPPRCCTSTSRPPALLVEIAAAAGLLATAADGARRPGVAADRRVRRLDHARPPAERWAVAGPRLAGQPADARPGRPARRGRQDLERPGARAGERVRRSESRRMALAALAALPPGEVLATGTGTAVRSSRGWRWQRPRRPRSRADQVAWTLAEAAALGVTGLGGPASYARVARCWPARSRGGAGPWRRCCPSRSTTC